MYSITLTVKIKLIKVSLNCGIWNTFSISKDKINILTKILSERETSLTHKIFDETFEGVDDQKFRLSDEIFDVALSNAFRRKFRRLLLFSGPRSIDWIRRIFCRHRDEGDERVQKSGFNFDRWGWKRVGSQKFYPGMRI